METKSRARSRCHWSFSDAEQHSEARMDYCEVVKSGRRGREIPLSSAARKRGKGKRGKETMRRRDEPPATTNNQRLVLRSMAFEPLCTLNIHAYCASPDQRLIRLDSTQEHPRSLPWYVEPSCIKYMYIIKHGLPVAPQVPGTTDNQVPDMLATFYARVTSSGALGG